MDEVTGILYRITATARRPENGKITTKVVADALWDVASVKMRIIIWKVTPE